MDDTQMFLYFLKSAQGLICVVKYAYNITDNDVFPQVSLFLPLVLLQRT